jgi:hypothetical protein
LSTPRQREEPRVARAIDELAGIIRARYPEAIFRVEHGADDPRAIHLVATIDVEDRDEVVDLVIDRMLNLQVDEGLPIYVVPVRPVERVAQTARARGASRVRASGRALLP